MYVPAYRASPTYIRNVNVTNVNVTNINVTNIDVTNVHYRNRDVPRAVTAVSEQTFVGARPVGSNAVIVPRERLSGAVVVGTAAPLAPTRVSVLAQPGAMRVRRPPETVIERRVVVKTPPPPARVPFWAAEPALRAQPGRPLDRSIWTRLRDSIGSRQPTPAVKPAVPANGSSAELRPVRGGLPAPHRQPPTGVLVPNPETPATNAPPPAESQPAPPHRRGPPPRQETAPPPASTAPVTPPPSNAPASPPARHQDRGRDHPTPADTASPRVQPPPSNAPPGPPRNPVSGRDRQAPPDTAARRGQVRPDKDKNRPGAPNDTASSKKPPPKRQPPKPRRGQQSDTTKGKP
jgi:hypothetical protein